MDKKRVARNVLFGVRGRAQSEHLGHQNVGGQDRHQSLFKYDDGCSTVYEHRDGKVFGIHRQPGESDVTFEKREGQAEQKHPHHPEGQRGAARRNDTLDALGQLAAGARRGVRFSLRQMKR